MCGDTCIVRLYERTIILLKKNKRNEWQSTAISKVSMNVLPTPSQGEGGGGSTLGLPFLCCINWKHWWRVLPLSISLYLHLSLCPSICHFLHLSHPADVCFYVYSRRRHLLHDTTEATLSAFWYLQSAIPARGSIHYRPLVYNFGDFLSEYAANGRNPVSLKTIILSDKNSTIRLREFTCLGYYIPLVSHNMKFKILVSIKMSVRPLLNAIPLKCILLKLCFI